MRFPFPALLPLVPSRIKLCGIRVVLVVHLDFILDVGSEAPRRDDLARVADGYIDPRGVLPEDRAGHRNPDGLPKADVDDGEVALPLLQRQALQNVVGRLSGARPVPLDSAVDLFPAPGLPFGVRGEDDEQPGAVRARGQQGGPDGADLELDDGLHRRVEVEEILKRVVLAAARALPFLDYAVEFQVENRPQDHAGHVGRGKDSEPGEDDARRRVGFLEALEYPENIFGGFDVFGDFRGADYAGEELGQEGVDGVEGVGDEPFGTIKKMLVRGVN